MQLSPQQFLVTNPIFNRVDLVQLLKERGGKSSEATASHYLSRWQKEGLIKAVKRGLYVLSIRDDKRLKLDPIIIGSRMSADAVIAYHSAMEVHGFAHSLFEKVMFITTTNVKPITFEGREIVPVKNKRLKKKTARGRWVEVVERDGIELHVTTRARTIVDAFDRLDLCGGIEEVWRSCLGLTSVDLREIEDYLKFVNCNVLYAKLGMFLEKQKDEFLVPASLLQRLERKIPRAHVYIDRFSVGEAKLIRRWHVMVPMTVVDKYLEGTWQ